MHLHHLIPALSLRNVTIVTTLLTITRSPSSLTTLQSTATITRTITAIPSATAIATPTAILSGMVEVTMNVKAEIEREAVAGLCVNAPIYTAMCCGEFRIGGIWGFDCEFWICFGSYLHDRFHYATDGVGVG